MKDEELAEVCDRCGWVRGHHCATSYYSKTYEMYIPRDYCPGTGGRMDWNNGPGTCFKKKEVKDEQGVSD